jgi:hypothetical protein
VVLIQEDDINGGVTTVAHEERKEILNVAYVQLSRGIHEAQERAVASGRGGVREGTGPDDGWDLPAEVGEPASRVDT